jgi:hypothetical protein
LPNTVCESIDFCRGYSGDYDSVNTKIESKFIQKQAAADNEKAVCMTQSLMKANRIIFGAFHNDKKQTLLQISMATMLKAGGVGYLFDYNLQTALDCFEIGAGATYTESHTKHCDRYA